MIYLYGKKGWTLSRLAKDGGFRYGLNPSYGDQVVNWGRFNPPAGTILNPFLVNKYKQLVRFNEAGLSAPKIWKSANQIVPMTIPFIGRRFSHTRGNDIIYYPNLFALGNSAPPSQFYVEYIPKVSEYRVHVLPPFTYISKKCGSSKEIVWSNDTTPFINHTDSNGNILFEEPNGLRGLAKKAVEAIGYDFGAVDIIEDSDGRLYVLEINSAPRLMNYRRQWYIDYFRREYEGNHNKDN